MGGNDRNTRALDREELAKLARESAEATEDKDKETTTDPVPAASRTATLQDPMTMALLAEVTRNAKTREFDPEALPTIDGEDSDEVTPVNPHPNVRRR